MKLDSKWKVALCLTAVFLAGAATGGLVSLKIAKNTLHRLARAENWEPAAMRYLDRNLHLTLEQEKQIQPVVAGLVRDLQTSRSAMIQQANQDLLAARRQIEPLLDEAQKAELAKMAEKRRDRMRTFFPDLPQE